MIRGEFLTIFLRECLRSLNALQPPVHHREATYISLEGINVRARCNYGRLASDRLLKFHVTAAGS